VLADMNDAEDVFGVWATARSGSGLTGLNDSLELAQPMGLDTPNSTFQQSRSMNAAA